MTYFGTDDLAGTLVYAELVLDSFQTFLGREYLEETDVKLDIGL